MRPLLLIGLLTMTACGHTITVIGRDGTHGTGTAISGVGAGTVDLAMNGERYRGDWTAVNTSSFSSNSIGRVLMQSDKGNRLRCEFTYGGFTSSGFGTCKDGTDRDYDMQIQ